MSHPSEWKTSAFFTADDWRACAIDWRNSRNEHYTAQAKLERAHRCELRAEAIEQGRPVTLDGYYNWSES